ncbi:MAG: cyclic nucleotide-binding domain-containing protein [Planctomycetes bacterium]|nr:cyclic nucleotide-binding domain-containing protein [Planctomycetota bacterium]
MGTLSMIDALNAHHFTKTMSQANRIRLAEGARPFDVPSGEFLAVEGEIAHAFYLIESGSVEIGSHLSERGSSAIQRVGAGDVVGWSWLLSPFRWEFDARAVNAVSGIEFNADWLRAECERDHDLGFNLVKQLLTVVSRRLAATRLQRMDLLR